MKLYGHLHVNPTTGELNFRLPWWNFALAWGMAKKMLQGKGQLHRPLGLFGLDAYIISIL